MRKVAAAGVTIFALGLVTAAVLPRILNAADPYEDGESLYSALREQPHTMLAVGGGEIAVVFADGAPGLDRERVLAWIRSSAQAMTTYFGQFPVHQVGLLVIADDSARIGGGAAYGFSHSAIRIHVGRLANDAAFRDDWILVHEMTHLALPTVPRQSEWLLEGNATYVEPIARAEAGQLDPSAIWRWAIEGMPKGQPQGGDLGLDHTNTWGRTYWGGATFWLMADIGILQATRGVVGAQEALRAINQRSGGNTAEWTVDQVMATGDAATGTHVLSSLYAKMGSSPAPTDVADLFRQLGVAERDGVIIYDDDAPLASIRRRITERRDHSSSQTSSEINEDRTL
jgi:hypothetical protein